MAEVIKEVVAPEESVGPVPAGGLRGFLAKFTVLKGAQRELWLTFLIKFLIYTAYSVTNKTMVLWLSKDLGFSDQAAGALVGWVWAPAMTVFTLLAGSLDRRDRFASHLFPWRRHLHRRAQRHGGDHDPVARADVRRSSAGRWRGARDAGVARSDTTLFNHGAALDLVFHHLHGDEHRLRRRRMDFRLRPAIWIFASASAALSQPRTSNCSSSAWPSRFCFSRQFISFGAAPTEDGENARCSPKHSDFWAPHWRDCAAKRSRHRQLFRRLIGQSGFYRLLVFFLFIGFLKAIFLQMDYVFPKWGDRELGPHAPVGKLVGNQFDRHYSSRPICRRA